MNYIISSNSYSIICKQIDSNYYEIYNMEGNKIGDASSNEIPKNWIGAINFLQKELAAAEVNLEDGVKVAEA